MERESRYWLGAVAVSAVALLAVALFPMIALQKLRASRGLVGAASVEQRVVFEERANISLDLATELARSGQLVGKSRGAVIAQLGRPYRESPTVLTYYAGVRGGFVALREKVYFDVRLDGSGKAESSEFWD